MVNTRNILFIMSGAFGELAEIIKKRLQRQGIGFEADVRPTEVPWEILKEVAAQDLIEFGFESEFVGRLPVVVVFDELRKEDLVEILKNPNNPIILSKRQDFRAYGIDIKFEDEALAKIAEMAVKEKTGARGLVSAMEKVLIPFEKNLPSTDIKKVLVTPELVDDPVGELSSLKQSPDDPKRLGRFERGARQELENIKAFITSRVRDFRQTSGLELYEKRIGLVAELYLKTICDINSAFDDFAQMYRQIKMEEETLFDQLETNITFDDSAVDEIIRQAIETGEEPRSLALGLAKKLEYGLKLVRDRAGVEDFVISGEAVIDMEKYINGLVKKHYQQEYDLPQPGSKEI
jgi:ATP-dependent protease Clp ATPase subunit